MNKKIEKKFKINQKNLASLFIFGPLFFIFIGIYYLFVKIINFISFPFQKNIVISKNKTKLNGISIIIPTWNKKELIISCLLLLDKILIKEVSIPIEIIVIENGSTDGSLQALYSLKLKNELIILAQKENLGFARAINLAASQSKYNYIYLMNNDMEVQKNTFAALIDSAQLYLKKGKIFFGLASQIFFHDIRKRREESGKTYLAPNAGFIKVAHVINDFNLQQNSLTMYPGGGSSLINKNIFLTLGGYDWHTYRPLYGEDLDLGYLAWRFGFPSYFCTNSHIVHHHRSSSKQISINPDDIMYKNFLAFMWKNFIASSNIFRHLFAYPFMMFISIRYRQYFLQLLPILPSIFWQRIKLSCYHSVYSDKQLLDFINFEINYEQT